MLDGKVSGAGKSFDWKAAKGFRREGKLLVLAGGLNEENVREAMDILRPDVVDVSSGVEGEDGKDALKIKKFIGLVRQK